MTIRTGDLHYVHGTPNIWKHPGMGFTAERLLPGALVIVLQCDKSQPKWCNVILPNGKTGWVHVTCLGLAISHFDA